MNSLLLGLALSSSPTTAAQPPLPPALPPGTPLTAPYRPGYSNPYKPVSNGYQPGYSTPHTPTYNPYQPGYPSRPTYYPPTAPPPFAPGEPTPGFPAPSGHHEPMTLAHFAKCFRPTPGHHTVCLIHPVTCRPIHVCFDLPHGCGCPKIDVDRRSIEFDYGRREIEIEFHRNGTYEVDYD